MLNNRIQQHNIPQTTTTQTTIAMSEKKEINMTFELPQNPQNSIIKVIGVGGGGSNAVNHMFRQGIRGVDFIICNTDQQALDASAIPTKVQLGLTLTEGRGAGSIPEVGRNAAIENIDDLRTILGRETKMVFVTAGMGGGTGTGAAPVIASTAREMGILTVGIVTIPFTFEGKKRRKQAEDGLEQLRKSVDTLLVISNDKLREIFGNLGLTAAFAEADNVLTTAAKGIAEIITVPGQINVDFADVNTVMKDGGSAIMGSAIADGEGAAMRALKSALSSPLLNDSSIRGAKHILVNIAYGEDIMMDEVGDLMDHMQEEAGWDANVIMGTSNDTSLGRSVCVTLVATGILTGQLEEERKVLKLDEQSNSTRSHVNEVVNTPKETQTSSSTSSTMRDADEDVLIQGADRPELNFVLSTVSEPSTSEAEESEQVRRSLERMENLKRLSIKLKTPSPVSDLESVPAFRRRNVHLQQVDVSSETNVSRYTLSENPDDKKPEIRPNNTFLHDNVD
jgi:cell division protein FtsZ